MSTVSKTNRANRKASPVVVSGFHDVSVDYKTIRQAMSEAIRGQGIASKGWKASAIMAMRGDKLPTRDEVLADGGNLQDLSSLVTLQFVGAKLSSTDIIELVHSVKTCRVGDMAKLAKEVVGGECAVNRKDGGRTWKVEPIKAKAGSVKAYNDKVASQTTPRQPVAKTEKAEKITIAVSPRGQVLDLFSQIAKLMPSVSVTNAVAFERLNKALTANVEAFKSCTAE